MNIFTLLLLLVMAITSEPLNAEKKMPSITAYPDSVLTIAHIRDSMMNNPDGALQMLDLAESRQLLPLYQINWTRAQIFGGPKQMGRIALNWAEIVLADDSVRSKPTRYVNMCKNIIEQLIYFREYEKALQYVDNMLNIAEREKPILLRIRHEAYWSIAYVYRMKGNSNEAYKFLDQAIQAAETSDLQQPAIYMDLHKFYLFKSSWLEEDLQYEKAMESALMAKELLQKMEPYRGGPFPDKIPEKYYQEYEAQTMLKLANLYQSTGQEIRGKEIFTSLKYNPSLKESEPVINQVINYLLNANRVKEGIEMTLPIANANSYRDTINEKRIKAFRILAYAHQKEGDYREAIQYAQQAFVLTDSLENRRQESNALELATLLETHEKEKMISRQADELRMHKVITYAACIMLILCCTILGLLMRHSRIINRKNKVMVKQINDRLFYKEELMKANEHIQQLEERKVNQTENNRQPISNETEKQEEIIETEATGPIKEVTEQIKTVETLQEVNMNDRRLFEELDRAIRKNNLFLDPDLNRDQILQLTQISKNRLAPLIQAFTGENFNGYINNLRLDYSLRLLKNFEYYTIKAIATDSGFNNVRTYQRLFRTKYDMTPAEYRKSQQDSDFQ